MFSIWEYRYSYGICFGTVYALQNSTPNISTPNILSFFSLSTPVGLKSDIFYVGDRDYKLKSIQSIQSKLNSIESKLKSIQSNFKSIQNKLKSIESKLKSVESNFKSIQK